MPGQEGERLAVGEPFPCPDCGASDWRADYYEAVHQGITLAVGADGKPEAVNYDGITGSYDDGSTEDEAWRCLRCEHEITHGEFKLVPKES